MMTNAPEPIIAVRNLKIGYGDKIILENVNFQVRHGEVFMILGGSGSGKSTLLKNLIGLYPPYDGEVWIEGADMVAARDEQRRLLFRKFGVLYQGGALFGSMTVLENVLLPLNEFTDLPEAAILPLRQGSKYDHDLCKTGDDRSRRIRDSCAAPASPAAPLHGRHTQSSRSQGGSEARGVASVVTVACEPFDVARVHAGIGAGSQDRL